MINHTRLHFWYIFVNDVQSESDNEEITDEQTEGYPTDQQGDKVQGKSCSRLKITKQT